MKNFDENPALQFITSAGTEPKAEPKPAEDQSKREEAQEGPYKAVYVEKRTERVQIVLAKSVNRKARAAAKKRGISLNAFIHEAIERELEREAEKK